MADDSGLPQQIQRIEKGVVFLRQEHLTMLHGLHLEILSLEKRCSELTTELEGKRRERSQFDLQGHEELLELRCRDMENCLHEQECSMGELRTELTHKGALVGALRANLKEKERNFLEELKRRSHCSTVLNTELQKQTETAAYLSFQLHAARQKLQHHRMQQRQGFLSRVHSQGIHYEPEQNYPSPQMASGAAPSSPVVKPKRKSGRVSSRVERARECVPMERVLGPAEPTAMPDPALFLNPRRHRVRQRHVSGSTPTPPGLGKEQEMEGEGGESEKSGKESTKAIVSSAVAPPAAENKAD